MELELMLELAVLLLYHTELVITELKISVELKLMESAKVQELTA
jgi:hypothetical protein